MFARKVTATLKPDSLSEFANLMECEILPWLRQQEGFLDLVILAAPDSEEITAISFWHHEEDARGYHSTGYPEVLKTLGDLLDGTPWVKTFDVVTSTLPQASLLGSSEADNLVREAPTARHRYQPHETHP